MALFGLTDDEKKRIREQHLELEKKEKEKKENLKKGTAFKVKEKEENPEEKK